MNQKCLFRIQTEHKAWEVFNFGEQSSTLALLGIVEEVGELYTALVNLEATKKDTGPFTRLAEELSAHVRDAIGDTCIYILSYCSARKWWIDQLPSTAPCAPFNLDMPIQIGKLCHAHLKFTQGIRGTPEAHEAAAKVQVQLVLGHLESICAEYGWNFIEVVNGTWDVVCERTWYIDPLNGTATSPTAIKNPAHSAQVTRIAKMCHEVNRAYCASIGDTSQRPWDDAPIWQKESAEAGVLAHIKNPDSTPADSHAGWLAHKEEQGWTYGPVKDEDKKTHPCMVPYEQLPAEQKVKDALFLAVVRNA